MIAIVIGPASAAYWPKVLLKLASTAAPFCIRFAVVAASSVRPKFRLQGTGITGEERHEAKNRTCGPWCDGDYRRAGDAIHPEGASARHAQRSRAVQRRSCLQQGTDAVRGTGEEILRQADQFHAAQELIARARKAVFRVHVPGQGGRLRHCLAGPHVDLRQGGAVHRCALCVQGHRAHEQGRRAEYSGVDRRRSRGQGRGRSDRLFGRRYPQHLRQQAAQEPRRS